MKTKGIWRNIVRVVAISMSLFQLYAARFIIPAFLLRSLHFSFVIILGLLLFRPARKIDKVNIFDILLIILGIASMGYVAVNHEYIMCRPPWVYKASLIQIVFAATAVVITLEVTRRVIGKFLPLLAIILLVYGFWGQYIPGVLNHSGVSISRMVDQMYLSFEGIFGIALGISASFIFIFMLFGAFLEKSGAGDFFIDFSKAITAGSRGGAAKMAVVASALMGTLIGSASANVVITGSFTIPMMKKCGYKKEFAAAVEVLSSTGGQIMPPIMGAGAFIMAEYLGIPYLQVAYHAIIPAVFFFIAVFMMIDFEAMKLNLKPIPPKERLKVKLVLKSGFYKVIPLIVLILVLLSGFTPRRAGLYAIVSTILISFFSKKDRMGFDKFKDALETGAINAIPVVTACACAGIVIGVMRATGLGLKFSNLVISASMGNLLMGLIIAAAAGIILGMGLPTTPTYIIQASLVAPALARLGLEPIVAHLFVFYFAVLSGMTPPVAVVAYAAAPLAQASPIKVGYKAFVLGIAAYFIPFMFVYEPKLILLNLSYYTIFAIIKAIIAIIILAAAVQGMFLVKTFYWQRIILALAFIILIIPGITRVVLGFSLITLVFILQLPKYEEQKNLSKYTKV